MPDLMGHLATTHLLRRAWEKGTGKDFDPRRAAMLYLGGCLPDLVSRVPTIVTGWLWRSGLLGADDASRLDDVWRCFHAPIPVLLVACLIVFAARQADRARYFGAAASAAGLHFGLDALQASIGDVGTYWLFPFSFATGFYPLFWPDRAILALPWLGALVFLAEWRRFRRKSGLTRSAAN